MITINTDTYKYAGQMLLSMWALYAGLVIV